MPPARQLEFLLRSFERAAKMRLLLGIHGAARGGGEPGRGEPRRPCEGGLQRFVEGGALRGEAHRGVSRRGQPDVVVSPAALRSLELLRGLKMFTKKCRPVKLFAEHLKVEEQAELLKARLNIACGTPSRIKKLIDMEALLLSRLKLVVLDMQRDAKSFTLFTLPQVSNELWDLYKGYLDQKVRGGDTRICFYGSVSEKYINKVLPSV